MTGSSRSPVAGPDGWPYARRAGARQRHRLLPAQPHAGRRRRTRPRDRPVARHGRGRGPQRHRAGARRRRPGRRRRVASPTTTRRSTSWSATRCCTTSPTSSSRCARSCASCKPGGRFVFAGEPTTVGDWYARRLGRLTWKATTTDHPARRRCATAGRGRPRSWPSRRGPRRWSRSSTSTPSTRATWRRRRCGPAPSTCGTDDRGAHRGVPRLAGPHLRGGGQPGAARLGLGDVRLPLVAAAVRRRPRARPGRSRSGCSTTSCSPGRALTDGGEWTRAAVTRGRCRCGAFVSAESLRWVLRHRAWTPYYLVRYWRFLRLRCGTRTSSPRASSSSAAASRCSARRGYGRIVLGRWVHLGDRRSLRAHEGTLRIGDKTVLGREDTLNCYLDIEHRAAVHRRRLGLRRRLRPPLRRRCTVPIKDQGIVKSPVRIGADVWVGVKASVLRGAQVGDGCVLAAHTVVKRRRARRTASSPASRDGWCATGRSRGQPLPSTGRRSPTWAASTRRSRARCGRTRRSCRPWAESPDRVPAPCAAAAARARPRRASTTPTPS